MSLRFVVLLHEVRAGFQASLTHRSETASAAQILAERRKPSGDAPSRSSPTTNTASRGNHLDWLFELESSTESSLLTFWSPLEVEGRSAEGACWFTRLPDHRRRYLDFEGELSADRGRVRQVMSGTHQFSECSAERFSTQCVVKHTNNKLTEKFGIQLPRPLDQSAFSFGLEGDGKRFRLTLRA